MTEDQGRPRRAAPDPFDAGAAPAGGPDDVWSRLDALPDLDDVPLDETWMPDRPAPPAPEQARPTAPVDPRRVRVGSPRPAYPVPGPDARVHMEPGVVEPGVVEPGPDHDIPVPPRRRRGRRRRGRVLLALVTLVALVVGGFLLAGWLLWNRVETVATEGALSPAGSIGTNYLIVGTDSRAGVSADLDTAPSIGLGVTGERSDTMVVLHLGDDGNRMVSLPRDLWVAYASGGAGKLNAARAIGGVPELIRTIRADPGIPVQHYLEVDLAGFLQVIEAVGSITIEFSRAACDPKSGLDVRATGAVSLDAEQALAYVRSRTYTEFDATAAAGLTCAEIRANGLGTEVGVADLGRTERQRRFLLAVFDEVAGTRNPVTLLRVLNDLSGGLRVDETLGMFDAIGLLQDLRGLNATTVGLPVTPVTIEGQSALTLTGDAPEVLASVATD